MPYTLSDLKAGDHILHIYTTESEYLAILTTYIQHGLARGERILYATDAVSADTILAALEAACCDPAPYVAKGQLVFIPGDVVYVPDGRFAPERLLATIGAILDESVAAGYPAVRLGGEMSWIARHKPDHESLLEYESRLNHRFPQKNYLLLCQYQRQRFPADMLLDMLRAHPVVIVGETISSNGYYVPGTSARHFHMGVNRLRTWLANLREHVSIPEPVEDAWQVSAALQTYQRARTVALKAYGVSKSEESNPQLYL